MPAEIAAKRLTREEPTMRTVRGGAVLLVVGVQDQEQVDGLLDDRIDLVRLARRREHHVQEVARRSGSSLRGYMNGWPIECL